MSLLSNIKSMFSKAKNAFSNSGEKLNKAKMEKATLAEYLSSQQFEDEELSEKEKYLSEHGLDESNGMITSNVNSSHLIRVAYNIFEEDLYITFKNGVTYWYEEIPLSTYDELMGAESIGTAFWRLIRRRVSYKTKY